MEIKVYGSSDDLIELDGGIHEEFYADCSGGGYLVFSNGTALSISYGFDGNWHIDVIQDNGDVKVVKWQDTKGYSDIALVNGDISWVIFGEKWVGTKNG